jgi:uncharacterized protein (DUF697 family)
VKSHVSSLGTGAYEFIPLPFLDEWLIKRQRRSMVEKILSMRGITYDTDVPSEIVGSGRSLMGRVGLLARGLVLKPLRKIFRSVFFWLTARNAARTAIVSYLLARFLQHPDLVPQNAGNHLSSDRARFLSEVLRDVSKNIEIRAARGAMRQLITVFARSKKTSQQEIGQSIEKSAPGFIAEFDTMVGQRLSQ